MAICLCFTWLSHLWSRFIGSSTIHDTAILESLPDDVMTDVLSRLPADQVVKLRKVCKRWCSLIATPHFVQLHLERSTPVMYFQTISSDLTFTLSSVDWSCRKGKQLIREIWSPIIELLASKSYLRFTGSCNGIFIFRREWVPPRTYCIFNPIRGEEVTIKPSLIVGFFFDSRTNKYQLVICVKAMDVFRFRIGSLGDVITWRNVGSFPYRPREAVAPSVVNGCLHWMAIGKRGEEVIWPPCTHSIMVFSIEHCEFRFLPHPVKVNESWVVRRKMEVRHTMHLLATKGHLYAYGMYGQLLDIWVLEDSANWYWAKKCRIHLEQHPVYDVPWMRQKIYLWQISQIKLLDIWKDEVLLVVPDNGFFRYYMLLKTIKKAQVAPVRNMRMVIEVKATNLNQRLKGAPSFPLNLCLGQEEPIPFQDSPSSATKPGYPWEASGEPEVTVDIIGKITN